MLKKYAYKIRSLMTRISGKKPATTAENPKEYWDQRFDEYAFHHSRQNLFIVNDFLQAIQDIPAFLAPVSRAGSVLEVGCGTGELSQVFASRFSGMNKIVATDISEEGINYCNRKNKFTNRVEYRVYNSLEQPDGFAALGKFDLAVCSNVLEHFRDPYPLLEQMLDVATYACILVPYNHLSDDTMLTGDGGEGHVFRFTEDSFDNYDLVATARFKSRGWSNVTDHPDPWQLTVLIRRKLI